MQKSFPSTLPSSGGETLNRLLHAGIVLAALVVVPGLGVAPTIADLTIGDPSDVASEAHVLDGPADQDVAVDVRVPFAYAGEDPEFRVNLSLGHLVASDTGALGVASGIASTDITEGCTEDAASAAIAGDFSCVGMPVAGSDGSFVVEPYLVWRADGAHHAAGTYVLRFTVQDAATDPPTPIASVRYAITLYDASSSCADACLAPAHASRPQPSTVQVALASSAGALPSDLAACLAGLAAAGFAGLALARRRR
jgi:hypothetical protein